MQTGKLSPDVLQRLVLGRLGRRRPEVLVGHTGGAPGLQTSITAMTAVGRARPDRILASRNARAGHDLVLTKAAGLEGTAILATDLADRLRARVADDVLARARAFIAEISVVRDGRL